MVIFTKVVCLLTLFSLSGMLIFHFIASRVLADVEYEYLALEDMFLYGASLFATKTFYGRDHILESTKAFNFSSLHDVLCLVLLLLPVALEIFGFVRRKKYGWIG